MKVIKTNIKAETVEINPREAEALCPSSRTEWYC